jgi:hypothetical protein
VIAREALWMARVKTELPGSWLTSRRGRDRLSPRGRASIPPGFSLPGLTRELNRSGLRYEEYRARLRTLQCTETLKWLLNRTLSTTRVSPFALRSSACPALVKTNLLWRNFARIVAGCHNSNSLDRRQTENLRMRLCLLQQYMSTRSLN